jgi:hypothetical protein
MIKTIKNKSSLALLLFFIAFISFSAIAPFFVNNNPVSAQSGTNPTTTQCSFRYRTRTVTDPYWASVHAWNQQETIQNLRQRGFTDVDALSRVVVLETYGADCPTDGVSYIPYMELDRDYNPTGVICWGPRNVTQRQFCLNENWESGELDVAAAAGGTTTVPAEGAEQLRGWFDSPGIPTAPPTGGSAIVGDEAGAGREFDPDQDPTDPNAGADGEEERPSCESTPLLSFGWLLCSVLRFIDWVLDFVDGRLNEMLAFPSGYLQDQNPDVPNSVEDAWGRFRVIAYALLIPIFLIMILSTALGFEFISAYTLKKAMPKMVFATIFIALSYPLLSEFIVIVNEIGGGIAGIVFSAFGTDGTITLASLFPADETYGWGTFYTLFMAAAALGAFIAFGSLFLLLLFGIAMILMILTIIILLAVREMLIVLLLILAPIAILAWIFPANAKLWGIWKESFFKLVFLYPLIMLLVSIGKGFALIASEIRFNQIDSGGEEVMYSSFGISLIIILTAYIAPYFFIPSTFRMAGSAFGTIQNWAMTKQQKWQGGLRKARSETAKKNANKFLGAKRFKEAPQGSMRHKINNLGGFMGTLKSGALPTDPRRWKSAFKAYDGASDMAGALEAPKNSKAAAEVQYDEFILRAMRESDGTKKGIKENLEFLNDRYELNMSAEDVDARAEKGASVFRDLGHGVAKDFATMYEAQTTGGYAWNDEQRDENGELIYQTNPDDTFKLDKNGNKMLKGGFSGDSSEAALQAVSQRVGDDRHKGIAMGNMMRKMASGAGRVELDMGGSGTVAARMGAQNWDKSTGALAPPTEKQQREMDDKILDGTDITTWMRAKPGDIQRSFIPAMRRRMQENSVKAANGDQAAAQQLGLDIAKLDRVQSSFNYAADDRTKPMAKALRSNTEQDAIPMVGEDGQVTQVSMFDFLEQSRNQQQYPDKHQTPEPYKDVQKSYETVTRSWSMGGGGDPADIQRRVIEDQLHGQQAAAAHTQAVHQPSQAQAQNGGGNGGGQAPSPTVAPSPSTPQPRSTSSQAIPENMAQTESGLYVPGTERVSGNKNTNPSQFVYGPSNTGGTSTTTPASGDSSSSTPTVSATPTSTPRSDASSTPPSSDTGDGNDAPRAPGSSGEPGDDNN